jgi:transcriptional regulator with XRE-family HTH domain
MATIFESLLARLDACSLPQIEEVAQASGVPFHTIAKIKRRETTNPRIETVERLICHFDSAKPRKPKTTTEAA